MPELIDLDNIALVVALIETDDRKGVGYVMEPVQNLHLQHNAFIDSVGRKHHAMVEGKDVYPSDETDRPLREYTLWFKEEHDPGFTIGDEIMRPHVPWRRAIPKADLVELDYRASIVPFKAKSMESDVLHECRFVIDCDGNVIVSITHSIYRTPGVVKNLNVGKRRPRSYSGTSSAASRNAIATRQFSSTTPTASWTCASATGASPASRAPSHAGNSGMKAMTTRLG